MGSECAQDRVCVALLRAQPGRPERPHGTRARYVLDGCRCLPCSDANAAYARQLLAERRPPWRVRAIAGGTKGAPPSYYRVEHTGTRQVEATELTIDEAYELRDHLNQTAWMDGEEPPGSRLAEWQVAAAARRHVRKLKASGVGYRRIAELAGCDRKLVQALMNGDRRTGREGRRFRRRILDRMMAIQMGDAAPGAWIDPTETWRLIAEMLAAGATRTRIARELGTKAKEPALQLGRGPHGRVTRQKADEVRALHDAFFRGSPRMREVCRCYADTECAS